MGRGEIAATCPSVRECPLSEAPGSAHVFDDFDELVQAVAVVPGELDRFLGALDDDTPFACPGDRWWLRPGDADDLDRFRESLELDEARIREVHSPSLRRLTARHDLVRVGNRSDACRGVHTLAP